jgi:photosystem II stability/assembly factor-like uncharacterized protein
MKYSFLTIIVVLIISTSCKKDKINESNLINFQIKGWSIDSIKFNYNWISPTDVAFINFKNGYIIGSNGDLLKTIDSAKTWTRTYIDSSGVMTSSMSFLNDSIGFIYGSWGINGNYYGILYKTIDGGNNWTKQIYNSAYHLLSMRFFDSVHGIALNWINSGSYVLTTNNGGANWNVANIDLDPSINRLFFLGDICYATGNNEKVFKSSDHGISWTSINLPSTSSNFVHGFYFLNENYGFLDLVNAKYKTLDGGKNWTIINLPFNNFSTPFSPFENFHFCNTNDGIFISDTSAYIGGDFPTFIGSFVYTTNNGGINWTKSTLLKRFSFGRIAFLSDNFAYCISNNYIYKLQKK